MSVAGLGGLEALEELEAPEGQVDREAVAKAFVVEGIRAPPVQMAILARPGPMEQRDLTVGWTASHLDGTMLSHVAQTLHRTAGAAR
ncbi:MAG TPA: hypothetical protein VK899_09105 [Gemmatimonadales bacterium]|nr:hypothetical protein [Gemmatimonadales bacterium]